MAVAAVLGSGQNADSERYAAAAVSTLEPLEPGPELAMAYSNMAQLRMLSDDNAAALDWGTKAIGLAREVGDTETEIHALNNVGTALATAGDPIEGQARLTQSLDLALARDAHEHAARAFTNLAVSTSSTGPSPMPTAICTPASRTAPTATSTPGGCT